jgi:ATP-dependent helicase HrpB
MLNRASSATLTQLRGRERRDSRGKDAPASDFTAQLELLRQAEKCHFRGDECSALGINAAAAAEISRDLKYFSNLRLPGAKPDKTELSPENALARTLLQCFPDRLARKLDQASLNCELQGRRRAQLSPRSMVRDEKFLIATEIRETESTGRPSGQLELALASGIREEWLWEFFEDSLQESDILFWDNARQQVMRRITLECRGLVLEESVRNATPSDEAAAMLAEQLESNSMPLTGWDDACEAWIDKVKFLSQHCPELNLPEFNEEERRAVRLEICRGESRYQAVRGKPALPFIQSLLTSAQRAAVAQLAPDTLPLPRGRKLRIEYHPGMPPKGRARIQELYDLKGPVTIANGKIPVLLDILAPNFRTVQITDDLPRFWEVHYPAARSQLARRYPKHEWR